MRMAEPPHCVKTSKMTGGTIPPQNRMRYSITDPAPVAQTATGAPLYHLYGGAVPSVLRRHGIYPCCKFISILWNFSSRMVCDHAKNVLRMPKGDTPWRTPVPMRAEPSLLRLCRVQPGEDRRSTPIRLNRKPYLDTAIVSRLDISLL